MLATADSAAQPQALILVVDDHAPNRRLLRLQLKTLGYEVDFAENGAEALQLWRNGAYRLILTDLHMPVMDGFDLAVAIRRVEQSGSAIPLYALTASASPEEMERAQSVGINGCLMKPLSVSDLESLLRRVMGEQVKPEVASELTPI